MRRIIATSLLACTVLGTACKNDPAGTDSDPTTGGESTEGPTSGASTSASSSTDGTSEPTTGSTSGSTTNDPTTGDPPDPAVGEAYLQWIESRKKYLEWLCACEVEAGSWTDINECIASYAVPPAVVTCNAGVLNNYPELKFMLDCYASAEAALVTCVTPTMCESDPAYECLNDHSNAIDACGQIPLAAVAAMEGECLGIQPFACDGGMIPGGLRCDGPAECADKTDEKDCPNRFTCNDGDSIPVDWKCDGTDDCGENEDEAGCPQWTCTNGEKISEAWHCNGPADCADKSDEKNCPDRFTCANGNSVPQSYVCDTWDDCGDNSDEAMCP